MLTHYYIYIAYIQTKMSHQCNAITPVGCRMTGLGLGVSGLKPITLWVWGMGNQILNPTVFAQL